MALPTKYKKLKSIGGQTEIGGAPFYSEDFVKLQENAAADVTAVYEKMRKRLPEFKVWDGAAVTKLFESGLIISGLEYNKVTPTSTEVSPGYIYSGGEVCYFPGGTFAISGGNPHILFLYKGAATYTSRTFEDASSKEMLVEHPVVVEANTVGGFGPSLPGGTGITATDEVVVLEIANNSGYYGENYFTPEAALGINGIGDEISTGDFNDAISLNATYGTALTTTRPFLKARKHKGIISIHGQLDFSSPPASGSMTNVCRLPGGTVTTAAPSIFLAWYSGPGGSSAVACRLDSLGDLTILEPSVGWGPSGTLTIEATVMDQAVAGYNYANDFLDIT